MFCPIKPPPSCRLTLPMRSESPALRHSDSMIHCTSAHGLHCRDEGFAWLAFQNDSKSASLYATVWNHIYLPVLFFCSSGEKVQILVIFFLAEDMKSSSWVHYFSCAGKIPIFISNRITNWLSLPLSRILRHFSQWGTGGHWTNHHLSISHCRGSRGWFLFDRAAIKNAAGNHSSRFL